MSNYRTDLEIASGTEEEADGRFYVWCGDDLVASRETYAEAERALAAHYADHHDPATGAHRAGEPPVKRAPRPLRSRR